VPRYYFDVKNGHRLIDNAGVDCRDDAQALDRAGFIAGKIAVEAPKSVGRNLLVLNDERNEIGIVPIVTSSGGT
jgi:hypothetical protein